MFGGYLCLLADRYIKYIVLNFYALFGCLCVLIKQKKIALLICKIMMQEFLLSNNVEWVSNWKSGSFII